MGGAPGSVVPYRAATCRAATCRVANAEDVAVPQSSASGAKDVRPQIPPLKLSTFVNPPSERLVRVGNQEGAVETVDEKSVLKRVKGG
jgi:hypothetical protein